MLAANNMYDTFFFKFCSEEFAYCTSFYRRIDEIYIISCSHKNCK